MKKRIAYKVDVSLDAHGVITECQCECAAGMGAEAHCKHVATVLLYPTNFHKQVVCKLKKAAQASSKPFTRQKNHLVSTLKVEITIHQTLIISIHSVLITSVPHLTDKPRHHTSEIVVFNNFLEDVMGDSNWLLGFPGDFEVHRRIPHDFHHFTRLQAEEERDKEHRTNNIVIYRVPESSSTLLKNHAANDTQVVLKFFNEGSNVGVDE